MVLVIGVLFCLFRWATPFFSGEQYRKPQVTTQIKYEMSFETLVQLAEDTGKNFGIVLFHPDCSLCERLQSQLYYNAALSSSRGVIYNIVDVTLPHNQWYLQLTLLGGFPAMLLFSPQAELIATVRGAAPVVLDCIRSIWAGDTDCVRYHHSRVLRQQASHEGILTALNLLIQAKRKIERGEDATAELNEAMQIIYYPYLVWLQAKNEKNLGNTENAVLWARQLLTFQEQPYADLYQDLFWAARYIINPDFDIAMLPQLVLDKDFVNIGNLQLNEKVEFAIPLRNEGKERLLISNINVGCSCLTLLDEPPLGLAPGEETVMQLAFTAEQRGEIMRRITIATNGVEPTQTVMVRARVR